MTKIEITPPGGTTTVIKSYVICETSASVTDKTGGFSITIHSHDSNIFDRYPVGSDVRIIQGENVFRGWILNPPKTIDGVTKILQLEGMSYTGRTQKIIVNEQYTNWCISDIVIDLFTKYMPGINLDSVVDCNKVISIKFDDTYLFDAMEMIAEAAGYEWFIDEPLPEEIDTGLEVEGWIESVDVVVRQVIYPFETLYPSDYLTPA